MGRSAGFAPLRILSTRVTAPEKVRKVNTVANQATGFDLRAPWVPWWASGLRARSAMRIRATQTNRLPGIPVRPHRARPGHVLEGGLESSGLVPQQIEAAPPAPALATSATFSMSFRAPRGTWLPGPRPPTPGRRLQECSTRLALTSPYMNDDPVTLPPGRARLLTSPLVTGSPGPAKTMGGPSGRLLGGQGGGRASGVTMTSTLSATSSAARAGSRSNFPSASRYSMTTLRPST